MSILLPIGTQRHHTSGAAHLEVVTQDPKFTVLKIRSHDENDRTGVTLDNHNRLQLIAALLDPDPVLKMETRYNVRSTQIDMDADNLTLEEVDKFLASAPGGCATIKQVQVPPKIETEVVDHSHDTKWTVDKSTHTDNILIGVDYEEGSGSYVITKESALKLAACLIRAAMET